MSYGFASFWRENSEVIRNLRGQAMTNDTTEDRIAYKPAAWARDLDGTGSLHVCAEGDPGAQPLFAAAALEALQAENDAGREWMRRAWDELNAIRARDGAPEGVSHEWWSELTDALDTMLGDHSKPWMTGAAKLLVAPVKAELAEAQARAEKAEAEVERVQQAYDDLVVRTGSPDYVNRLVWRHIEPGEGG